MVIQTIYMTVVFGTTVVVIGSITDIPIRPFNQLN